MPPRWIPQRTDVAGLALVGALGGGAVLLTRALPRSPLVSDVLVAMLLGALLVNTPLGRALGVRLSRGCATAQDRYAGGVAFACSWLLRLAIVLMGLKVQTSSIGGAELLLVLAVCATSIPATFFVAQTLSARLGLRRPFGDLLAAGSMICGASAVNATAPIVGAERQEQGLAVGIVFLSSVAAMLSFRAIAHAVGLPAADAGLWAGLAVNDLSSAVAVGIQMGGDGGVTAAAAKSTRILMMAPMLVGLALLRRPRGATADSVRDAAHAPADDAAASAAPTTASATSAAAPAAAPATASAAPAAANAASASAATASAASAAPAAANAASAAPTTASAAIATAAAPAATLAAASAASAAAPPRLDATLRKSIMAALPHFILGYLALALVRVAGDRAFGAAAEWHAVLATNRTVVEILMAMVSAGIGLNLAFGALLTSSSRGIAASVGASAFMAALTLVMVTAAHRHGLPAALGVGAAGLFLAYATHCRLGGRRSAHEPSAPADSASLVNPDCALARHLADPR